MGITLLGMWARRENARRARAKIGLVLGGQRVRGVLLPGSERWSAQREGRADASGVLASGMWVTTSVSAVTQRMKQVWAL